MAQWSRADHTLHTKVVYYGPAFGGKTTNLEALHRITDPRGHSKLITLQTSDDRTLFFDLLPFDLGEILGHQVSVKLYTVPGQVRYDTTRRVVLGGADAVIFVADSSGGRERENRWSLQNLQMNMRAKGLDPRHVPVLFQFNKQDLANAVPPGEVARWLGLRPNRGFPAVATEGRGVLETFVAATSAMLERLVARADTRTRAEIDPAMLREHLDRALAPYLARQLESGLDGTPHEQRAEDRMPLVFDGEDLLASSVQSGVRLGERLAAESERATRIEREVEALRRLGEMLHTVGASFDPDSIVDAALRTVAEVLETGAVSVISRPGEGPATLDRSWRGAMDPLLASDEGRRLLERVAGTDRPCVVDDLDEACSARFAAVAAVPLASPRGKWLLAYTERPDGAFVQADVRFLASVANHLAVGLEKASLYDRLAAQKSRLEQLVEERTAQLRKAYEDLRGLDKMKDRFLGALSHEMKTPLTAVLSSALFLRDYETSADQRREMIGSIVESGQTLQRLLDDLFRVTGLEDQSRPLERSDVTAEALVREAVQLSGHRAIRCRIAGLPGAFRVDVARLARAVSNLIDNAAKFSPPGAKVELAVRQAAVRLGGRNVPGLVISVLDRGPGVPEADRERIFAPFEQGGDPLTGKPAGIGIGLYEARVIARQHGGAVSYRPRERGGSEFRLSLPLRACAARQRVPAAAVPETS
jgi:signal transduction histidine kinase/signal recognition particle receptor subunit beta